MVRLCKFGCSRPAGWTTGRLANVCAECKPLADAQFVERCAATREAKRSRKVLVCEYRGCKAESVERLFFGDAGAPGVNYCSTHVRIVRACFHVRGQTLPRLTRQERHQFTAAAA